MKHAQSVAIGLSIVLGIGALAGCQRGEPTAETNPTAEPAPETAVSAPEEPPTAPSETAEAAPNDAGETPIDPPQSASLTAQEANAEINVRSQPNVDSTSTDYGLAGDAVKLLKTVDGDDGFAWYYVEFDEWEIEGWVRGDLIDTGDAATTADTG
ncbi:MAG: SH3 domain-containing protein [Cyanobacteria bacterium J06636_16]